MVKDKDDFQEYSRPISNYKKSFKGTKLYWLNA